MPTPSATCYRTRRGRRNCAIERDLPCWRGVPPARAESAWTARAMHFSQVLQDAWHSAPPAHLAEHAVVFYSHWSTKDEWHSDGPSVRPDPWLHTNSGDTCRTLALGHHGVILQRTFFGQGRPAGRYAGRTDARVPV